jgi:hypothetical protein
MIVKTMVNKCKEQLKKEGYNGLNIYDHDYCILCMCQKLHISLDKFLDPKVDLAFWTVDMKAIIQNTKSILSKTYLELGSLG